MYGTGQQSDFSSNRTGDDKTLFGMFCNNLHPPPPLDFSIFNCVHSITCEIKITHYKLSRFPYVCRLYIRIIPLPVDTWGVIFLDSDGWGEDTVGRGRGVHW